MAFKGKLFKSPFSGFRAQVRSEAIIYHPNTGVEINRVPALTAEFGIFGEEFDQTLPDGSTHRSASITGGFFDSAEAAERLGWTPDEHDSVVAELERWSTRWPEAVQVFSKQPAGKPWPTFDDAHHNQISVLAEQLGLVAEALAYEVENENRESVVSKLQEIVEKQSSEAVPEELTAA